MILQLHYYLLFTELKKTIKILIHDTIYYFNKQHHCYRYDQIKEILEIEFKLKVIQHYFNLLLDDFVSLMKANHIEEFYFDFIQCSYHFDVF
ncbi:MAG: KTSC domain-containing protein [Flavobacteriaceae bacterium]|nr:KTSC domain-containing protein [Flavobacteriaceae bacterium]